MHHHTWCRRGSWGPNPGLHECQASTLPPEPTPVPCLFLVSAPWRVHSQFCTNHLTWCTLTLLESCALLGSGIQKCFLKVLSPFLALPPLKDLPLPESKLGVLNTFEPHPPQLQDITRAFQVVVALPVTKESLGFFLLAGCAV